MLGLFVALSAVANLLSLMLPPQQTTVPAIF
jgi:hypothetical protein